jgi:hypothetical protein
MSQRAPSRCLLPLILPPILLPALLGALLLAACQPVSVRESAAGPWAPLPEGSTLTLTQTVPVPQDRARVFLLGGRLAPQGASIGPSCGLEIRTISRDGPYRIAPGTYAIERVQSVWTSVALRARPGDVRLRLASAPDGGGNPMIQEGYHFWLAGPDANLMRLTCLGRLDDIAWSEPPTLEEIRSALGRVARIESPGP